MTESVDVVVIGSGAGGGVVAKELGEAGVNVIVLDAGKRYVPERDYHTDVADFETLSHGIFDAIDPRRDRYTVGAGPFDLNRVKGIGGSTLHYVGITPRFHESDFRTRSLDGVGDDWPMSYAELEPYYDRVEYEFGVSGPSGACENPFDSPRSRPFPTPPHPFNMTSRVIKRGAAKLGLHFVREPVAIPTRPWNGRPACIGAGTCHIGCKIAAKSSIDVTYVPKAEATGRVEFRAESMAREIKVVPNGKVKSVVYIDASGVNHEIEARAVVVAGSAIETPRLLLMSRSSQFPQGLANSSGLVGKYFMEHLAVFAGAVFEDRIDSWRGIPSGGMIQDYYETSKKNDFARGFSILVSNGSHWPLGVSRRTKGWGNAHKMRTRELFWHSIRITSVGEQLPDVRNEVTLDPQETDSWGLPVPRITNRLVANDVAMVRRISSALAELLKAAGAKEMLDSALVPGGSAHYMGTCRMGSDPAKSVVDSWGRCHDVPNLFVGDSSAFVTGAGVNPALTISAFGARVADGIIAAFKRREL